MTRPSISSSHSQNGISAHGASGRKQLLEPSNRKKIRRQKSRNILEPSINSSPSTLPHVEKTPVLIIYFSAHASPRLIDLVVERLTAGGLVCLHRSQYEGKTLLRLTTTQEMLEATAESIHLMKVTADTQTVEYFTVKDRHRFCDNTRHQQKQIELNDLYQHGALKPKTTRKRTGSELVQLNVDPHGMFNSNEWSLLIRRILDDITVLPYKETSSELSRILDEKYHADYHVRN